MSPHHPVRLILADDHALFRQGLRSILSLHDEVTVVGEVERAADLHTTLQSISCDLLLLDLQMERATLGELPELSRLVGVVVVTASELPEAALAAIQAGARGIVFKRYAIETLMDAIRAVAVGQMWMPPAVQAELAARWREPVVESLTPREREIVGLVAHGLRNAEIGSRLFISEVTVKTHLNNVLKKLAIRDRVELTRYALRVGLVGVDDPSG